MLVDEPTNAVGAASATGRNAQARAKVRDRPRAERDGGANFAIGHTITEADIHDADCALHGRCE